MTPISHRCCVQRILLACLLALPVVLARPADAQDLPPDGVNNYVFPSNGVAAADQLFVLYGEQCGRYATDATRAPEVVRAGIEVLVTVFLIDRREDFCVAAVLPPKLVPVSIGRLAKGSYSIKRRLMARKEGEREYQSIHEASIPLFVGDVPNAAISGVWFDPAVPGEGVVINLLPPAPGEFEQRVLVYFATRDSARQAQWFTGIGRFEDGVASVTLLPGGDATTIPAIQASFAYQGCGEARFRFGPAPPMLGSRNAVYQQLTRVAGVKSCQPPPFLGGD